MTASNKAAPVPTSFGFIGLGAMGKPMALNLAKKLPPGSRVHVYDIAASAVDELCHAQPGNVIACKNAKDVTMKSEVVFTIVPEGSHVKSVYLDAETGIVAGLLSSASTAAPKIVIDSSTIDIATSILVKEQLASSSPATAFYDAPVSGGVLRASSGTIAFFLGCSKDDSNLPLLTSLMRTMGSEVITCGGHSLGLAAKLSNNYLSGIITIACSEAMDMGMRAGIDADVLASVFKAGTAQNTICDVFNPVPGVCPAAPSSHGYRGGFRVQLMRKDIGLAVDMARQLGSRNVLGTSGLGVYAAASAAPDCKDLDSRVVFRYIGGNEHWAKKDS
ncbi:3-hydroxyacid dehydrogenase/reductase [Niveomyces insectorum RCEF 264]|uniref:3-hydroxyisobutyrate dehydrogenase n=1 Tax=Niveomyces insectorum RCEF 264 TaxID=1081102 RepID=A0A167MNA4_9HYPO|nr:3-hydroxyacid dehydrogenase/reductase [Niveomyces insectorum RCEF 264]